MGVFAAGLLLAGCVDMAYKKILKICYSGFCNIAMD